MHKRWIALLSVSTVLSGCTWMFPYEEEFSCRKTDNYGKCISSGEAYHEAVTGESQGERLVPHSEQEAPGNKTVASSPSTDNRATINNATDPVNTTPLLAGEKAYKHALYQELQTLLEQPRTPMIKPPKTIRVLILPASHEGSGSVFMPRYVYSILSPAQWVVGDYIVDTPKRRHLTLDPKGLPQP